MIELKRGATLSFLVIRKDEEGLPLTGDAPKLKSQLRDKADVLVGEFNISETATLGTYLFEIPAIETAEFPLGTLLYDILYTDNGTVQPTVTDEIVVIKGITR